MTSANGTKKHDIVNRCLAIGGMVGAIAFIPIAFIIGETRAGYSHMAQGISVLSNSTAPSAWAQSTNFIVMGVLTIGLAIALVRGLGTRAVLGAVLIGAFGLGATLNGIFPEDTVGTPETTAGTIHAMTAGLGFLTAIVSMFVLPSRLPDDEAWRLPARLGRWMGVASIILMVTFLMAKEEAVAAWTPWTGLFQRALGATVLLWLVLLALGLIRSSGQSEGMAIQESS